MNWTDLILFCYLSLWLQFYKAGSIFLIKAYKESNDPLGEGREALGFLDWPQTVAATITYICEVVRSCRTLGGTAFLSPPNAWPLKVSPSKQTYLCVVAGMSLLLFGIFAISSQISHKRQC